MLHLLNPLHKFEEFSVTLRQFGKCLEVLGLIIHGKERQTIPASVSCKISLAMRFHLPGCSHRKYPQDLKEVACIYHAKIIYSRYFRSNKDFYRGLGKGQIQCNSFFKSPSLSFESYHKSRAAQYFGITT